ncbi:MAG: class I SAM-dependent methyltransferase [Thermodesulfovibrionales bacterium]
MKGYRERCFEAYNLHFEQFHSFSREEFNLYHKVAKKRFKPFIPTSKDSKILDVACGAGHFLYFLIKEGYRNVYGIDISEKQLEIARNMGITSVERADLFEYLPNHPQEYDLIVANDIIEHLKKEEIFNFLDLIWKALKPEGKAIISTCNASSLFGARSRYIDITHEVSFTPESLYEVLMVTGFNDIKIYGEEPVIHDLRSFIRALLWRFTTKILKIYVSIETGTGRGMWKRTDFFEPRIFAVAKKTSNGK